MYNKKKLKILPLQSWMTSKYYFPKYLLEQEIKPILNKNGYYFSRKGWYFTNGYYKWQDEYSWFEYNGKAYWYSIDSFKFELRIQEASEYDNRIMKLFNQIPSNYLNKDQRDRLYYWHCFYQCKNTYRSSRIEASKMLDRINKFKNEKQDTI